MLSIVLVSGSPLLREGLKWLVDKQPGLQLTEFYSDAKTALQPIVTAKPAAAVIDYASEDAVTLTVDLIGAGVGVVALIKDGNERNVAQAVAAGATAVVPGDALEDEILSAIRDAAQGRKHLSPVLTRPHAPGNMFTRLSGREREVFVLLVKGMTNHQVAQALFISVKTVETHRGRIYQKLGLHSVAELVHTAYREGIIAA
jgi:two-component system response regulator NreC